MGKSMDEWWAERTLPQKVLLGIGFAIAGLGFVALIGLALLLLWNWLMPEIFGLPEINYWQSLGLFAMSVILFRRVTLKDDENDKKQEKRRKEHLRQQMAAERAEADVPAGETPKVAADTSQRDGAPEGREPGKEADA